MVSGELLYTLDEGTAEESKTPVWYMWQRILSDSTSIDRTMMCVYTSLHLSGAS